MVSNIITRVPVFSLPEYDQIGPIMGEAKIWKVKDITDSLSRSTAPVKTTPLSAISIDIEYQDLGWHRATITLEEGRIICKYCTRDSKVVTWCKHIQYLAKNHLDCTLFNAEVEDRYLIPIVPTDGIFMPIIVKPDVTRQGFTDIAIEVSRIEDQEIEEHVIGHVFSNFGLIELRSMVADFLEGWLSNEKFFLKIPDQDPRYTDPVTEAWARKRDATVSSFANKMYRAIVGETLGSIEAKTRASSDAPTF